MSENPKIELLVSPKTLTMNNRPEFWVGVQLINQSDKPIAFDISDLTLFVNGERSITWDLAVQNGTIINLKIGPHQSESVQWPLGEALFEAAGKYELILQSGKFSIKQTVIVND